MRPPRSRKLAILGAGGLATAAAAGWFAFGRGLPPDAGTVKAVAAEKPAATAVAVEVVRPRPGGIDRVCSQPGTVEPFEGANLYSKVAGFLAEQSVDIGSRVKKGQVLAKISVPEYVKAVERDEAKLLNAKSRAAQAEAALVSARADARAAKSLVAFAEAEVKAKASFTTFRRKQFDRFRQLNDQQAIDARLVDEKEDQFEAAQSAEFAAREQVVNAKAKAESADAKVVSAVADVDEAKSEIAVAAAELDRSKVWVDYATITSPYDGVVTKRTFFPGDFIPTADRGGEPMLAVDRTDLMRVVVAVPDRDVPFVTVGDPATLEIDALPGRTFAGTVARSADAENLATRTMRTEVDVKNTDGSLRRGMYGKATIVLDKGSPGAVRVPTAALVARVGTSQADVRVVRDGLARTTRVRLGADNGIDIEVVEGLTVNDQVILRTTSPVVDGTPVTVPAAGH